MDIDAELSNNNATDIDGRRMSFKEYGEWRQRKIREKLSVDKRISSLKLKRKSLGMRFSTLQSESYVQKRREVIDTESAGLRVEIDRLKKACAEWESKYWTLERQYDAVIRQLNAVPKSVRM